MPDEISEHLNALARDDCYRVDAVLKESASETTERVFFQGSNGAELGPFVRKRIDCEAGEGAGYECLCAAQRAGRRFLHLPRVYDCHRADGCLVVVMEQVEGETLAAAVARAGASTMLAARVFPQLCDAATELHEGLGVLIVHRDLKPSNVMLSHDGATLTVIDFGIARVWKEDADEDTRHFGTRAYAPPEQFGFGQTDARSDVYALGMLLYFCLTGCAPSVQSRSNGFADAQVPEAFRQVIAHAAAFDPQARYATAAEAKRAFLSTQAELEGRGAASAAKAGFAYAAGSANPAASADSPPSSPKAGETPQSAGSWSGVGGPSAKTGEGKAPWQEPGEPSAAESSKGQQGGSRGMGGTRASRAAGSAKGRQSNSLRALIDRIPLWLGIVWDVFLFLFALLLVAACVSTVFDPQPGSSLAADSLAQRAFEMVCISLLLFLPGLFFLRDRRPLRRLFPRMRHVRMRVEFAFVMGALAVCFLMFGLMEALFS